MNGEKSDSGPQSCQHHLDPSPGWESKDTEAVCCHSQVCPLNCLHQASHGPLSPDMPQGTLSQWLKQGVATPPTLHTPQRSHNNGRPHGWKVESKRYTFTIFRNFPLLGGECWIRSASDLEAGMKTVWQIYGWTYA